MFLTIYYLVLGITWSVTALTIWETPKVILPIEELLEIPSSEKFYDNFATFGLLSGSVKTGKPFLIRNFQNSTDFSDERILSQLSDELILQVETALKETRTSDNLFNKVTWAEFISEYRSKPWYAVTPIPTAFRDELKLPPFFSSGGLSWFMDTPILWVAANKTQSVIHRDAEDNFHCVISGTKRFLIWNPKTEIARNFSGWTEQIGYGSFANIDVDGVDVEKFPGWLEFEASYAEISNGDCLFLPSGYFHYVESGAVFESSLTPTHTTASPPYGSHSTHSSSDMYRTVSVHVWFKPPPVFVRSDINPFESFGISSCVFADDPWFSETGKNSALVQEILNVPGRTSGCRFGI